MIKKCLVAAVCLVFLFSLNNSLYAYWVSDESTYENINLSSVKVVVGTFTSLFCFKPNNHTLIVNNCFKNKFMFETHENNFEWKRDIYNNIVNRQEIINLTPLNTIVYVNNTPFLVVSGNYNLIDHGIPNLNNPTSWALVPMVVNYVSGWAYRENHVVKTKNNEFYMAKHYTTDNPQSIRTNWNKIEPVTNANFSVLENPNLTDYRNPIFSTIIRSYIYDNFNTYLSGDVVLYNNTEWVAKTSNTNVLPNPQNSWAWTIKTWTK